MHESIIAAARNLAEAIVNNGNPEEIAIYNLTDNLIDFLEDFDHAEMLELPTKK